MQAHAIPPPAGPPAVAAQAERPDERAWVGPDGLIQDCWERILSQADLPTWWRARGACRELRALALTAPVMRAQLVRPGVGRLPSARVLELSNSGLQAKLRMRLALARNLAARGLSVDLPCLALPPEDRPAWVQLLRHDRLLRGTADGRADVLALGPPSQRCPSKLPPLAVDETHVSLALTSPLGEIFWHVTARRLLWWAADGLQALGQLEAPRDDDIACGSVAIDGLLAGAITQSGAAHVVTAFRHQLQRRWDWRPTHLSQAQGDREAQVPLSLTLPEGGRDAVVLAGEPCGTLTLTCWRLTAAGAAVQWGPTAITSPTRQPIAWPCRLPFTLRVGEGGCDLSSDQQHLTVVVQTEVQGRSTTTPPILLRLGANLAPEDCPILLRRAMSVDNGEEDEHHLVWSPSGRELMVGVQAPSGDFVRRWEMTGGDGPIARATHRFGDGDRSDMQRAINGGDGVISHLAVSYDGVRVALARPGGRVEMWRLDGADADLRWTFKPGLANYNRFAFISEDTRLLLSLVGGGVVVLNLIADLPRQVAISFPPVEVEPGVSLRGLEDFHLGAAWVARLRPN